MKGKIKIINVKRRLVALETEEGEYTAFEILGDFNIDLGDIIDGDLESLGDKIFTNLTRSRKMTVMVKDIHGTFDSAMKATFVG